MKITAIKKTETNNHYDQEKTANGGGYSQPEYYIYFDDGGVLHVHDVSCGEFGTRYYAMHEDTCRSACWGSMQEKANCVWSDFTEEDRDLIDMVEKAVGIRIITKETIEKMEAD